MKLYIKLLIILFLFTGSACDKKDALSPEEQLPEATQNGANTAGCLVDGEVFLPDGESLNSGSVLKAQYILSDEKYIFGLSIRNLKVGNRMVMIESKNEQLEEGKTYVMNEYSDTSATGVYLTGLDGFSTSDEVIGEFDITKLDETNSIISGTFWFDAVNEEGEVVKIREGRFDVRY